MRRAIGNETGAAKPGVHGWPAGAASVAGGAAFGTRLVAGTAAGLGAAPVPPAGADICISVSDGVSSGEGVAARASGRGGVEFRVLGDEKLEPFEGFPDPQIVGVVDVDQFLVIGNSLQGFVVGLAQAAEGQFHRNNDAGDCGIDGVDLLVLLHGIANFALRFHAGGDADVGLGDQGTARMIGGEFGEFLLGLGVFAVEEQLLGRQQLGGDAGAGAGIFPLMSSSALAAGGLPGAAAVISDGTLSNSWLASASFWLLFQTTVPATAAMTATTIAPAKTCLRWVCSQP